MGRVGPRSLGNEETMVRWGGLGGQARGGGSGAKVCHRAGCSVP